MGALLISSGIALMASPMSASADTDHAKVVVCKYVGTPGASDLQTGNNPIETSINTLRNTFESDEAEAAWFANPTFPRAWTDAQGQAGGSIAIGFVGEVPSELSQCPGYEPGDLIAHASLVLVDPSCDNGNTASFEVTGSHAYLQWAKVDGHQVDATMGQSVSVEPGASISVKVHADQNFKFENGEMSGKVLTLVGTVGPAQVNCTAVTPAAPTFVEPTCTTEPQVQLPQSELVTYAVEGDVVAGGGVEVTATLVDTETTHFAEGATTTWPYEFIVPTGCESVEPPVVEPPTEEPTATEPTTTEVAGPTTPTVVHAGLAGEAAGSGARDEGVALVLAGLLVLAGAGLGLVRGGERPTS